MDRGIIYPGQVPLETDLLFAQKSSMVGLAKLTAALLGTATFANGLTVVPNSPAALNVLVNPGEIYSLVNLDGTAYSSIAADTTHQIVKQGISLDQVTLACPAPGTVGFSINYLIEAAYADTDATPVVLPYYNASNPSTAYSGPANAGTAQNTRRLGQVSLVAKAGVAATTGTQTTPSADAGYVGLYVVTVAYGQTQITAGNITAVAGSPVLPSAGIVAGGFQGNYFNIASAAGTADAITASYTPGIGSLTNGMTLYLRAASANATTTPTFTPNSGVIAAKNIVKGAGSALAAGDIAGAGHWIELQYDLSLDRWVLLNPATGISAASGAVLSNITRYSTAGSGTYNKPANVKKLLIRAIGGGGGGAGDYGDFGAGGGGGSGAFTEILLTSPASSYAYTVGAAGAAGAGSGGAGGAGGATTIAGMSAGGGGGGYGLAGSGGVGGTPTGGDVNIAGDGGSAGGIKGGSSVNSGAGKGGSGFWGGGGKGGGNSGYSGGAGVFGGGGGGAALGGAAAAGGAGYIEIWEFI